VRWIKSKIVIYGFNYGESNARTYIILFFRLVEKKIGKYFFCKNVNSLVNAIQDASFKRFKYVN
jgi:hypothetical protein